MSVSLSFMVQPTLESRCRGRGIEGAEREEIVSRSLTRSSLWRVLPASSGEDLQGFLGKVLCEGKFTSERLPEEHQSQAVVADTT